MAGYLPPQRRYTTQEGNNANYIDSRLIMLVQLANRHTPA